MNFAGILQVIESNQKITSNRSDNVIQTAAESDSFAQIYSELDAAETSLDTSNQDTPNEEADAGSSISAVATNDEDAPNSDLELSLGKSVDDAAHTDEPSAQPEEGATDTAVESEQENASATEHEDQTPDTVAAESDAIAAEATIMQHVSSPQQTAQTEQGAATKAVFAATAPVHTKRDGEQAVPASAETSKTTAEAAQLVPEEGANVQTAEQKEMPGSKPAPVSSNLQQQPEIVQDRVQAKAEERDTAAGIPRTSGTTPLQPDAGQQGATPFIEPREKRSETAAVTTASQTMQTSKALSDGAASGETLNRDQGDGRNTEGQETRSAVVNSDNATASDRRITSTGFVSSAALLAQSGMPQTAQMEEVSFDRISDLRFGANSIGITQALTEAVFRPNVAHSPDTAQRIAVQLTAAFASKGERKVDVMLNPKELGRVNMQLATSDTGVKVIINAERGDTIDLMRRHVSELEKEFKSMGFETISFEFSSGNPDQQSQQSAEHAIGTSARKIVESGEELPVSTQPIQTLRLGETGLDMRV